MGNGFISDTFSERSERPFRVKGDGINLLPYSLYTHLCLYYIMWIIDNIVRGLGIMIQITLFGYAFIGIYLSIKHRLKSRKNW